MKFNLKNRPKTCSEQDLCPADWDVAQWFEEFEKELRRQMLKSKHSEVIKLIKEILGDA